MDDHWLGDVLGAVALFVSGWLMVVIAGVLS
jgi:hypothetical protein